MAITDSYVSTPNYSAGRDRAKQAYDRSLIQYNEQKNRILQSQGIQGVGNLQDYLKPGAVIDFDYGTNPYGGYQQMRGRQGLDIQANEEDAYARGLGGSGLQANQDLQARFAHTGQVQDWRQGVMGNLTDLLMGVRNEDNQYTDTVQALDSEETQYNAWKRLHDPVTDPAASPVVGGDPTNPATPAGKLAGQQAVNQANSKLEQANRTGNTAVLAAIFKDTSLPEDVRRKADQLLKKWRAIRAQRPREGAGHTPIITPDPHPSVPTPDPYR